MSTRGDQHHAAFAPGRRTSEIKIYAGHGHLFGARVLGADTLAAQKRRLDFLAKHLKPADTARS